MFDDQPPKPAKLDLEQMSVQELKQRIAALKAEIAACESEIDKKEAHRSSADDFFKK